MNNELSYHNVINLLKSRHPKAASLVYDAHAPVLNGIIYKILKDEKQAEQFLISFFAEICDSIHSFDETKNSFNGWLIDSCRKKAFTCKIKSPDRTGDVTALKQLIREGSDEKARKKILEMVYYHKYTPDEIALMIDEPKTHVIKEISMALKQYRTA